MKYINKPDKLRWAMAAVSAAMLVIMALCLSKTYAISRQQTDTLEQIMELRQELDASSRTDIEQARKALLCARCGRENYARTVRT